MPLVIQNTATVPSDGWTYLVEATGYTVFTRNYSMLYQMIVQHCQANNVPPPSEQDVIDKLCEEKHIPCYNSETRQPLVNKFLLGLPEPAPLGCCGK